MKVDCVGCGCCCTAAPMGEDEARRINSKTNCDFALIIAPQERFALPHGTAAQINDEGGDMNNTIALCDFLYYSPKE